MTENIEFRADLRLLLELGERLISKDEIAVVELVKNAYDADADEVRVTIGDSRIEVIDDGDGMAKQDIEEGWLTIGTPVKSQKTRTAKSRRVLGKKGVGRLAVLKLGKKITILTQKPEQPCYKFIMDWKQTKEDLETSSRYAPLTDLAITLEEVESGLFPKGKGTAIIIEELNNFWDADKTERLKVSLSKLVNPRFTLCEENAPDGEGPDNRSCEDADRFEIILNANGCDLPLEPPGFTKNPHYEMEVVVNADGTYIGVINWHLDKGEGEEHFTGNIDLWRNARWKKDDPSIKDWKIGAVLGCGPFSFKVSVWDLDSKELRGSKRLLNQWSGISLVRDNFRVVQPEIDWLGLDLRRVQNPTTRLSTNQIIGTVYITSDTNPLLVDKTDREGLLDNDALKIQRETIYGLLNILEQQRKKLRREKSLSKGIMLDSLDSRPIKSIVSLLPPEKRQEVTDFSNNLDNFRVMLEEWMLGRDRMATMGMLGGRLIHEARSALMKITDNYPLIESELHKIEPPLRKPINRMVDGGKLLATIFDELNPFLRFRQKMKQDVILKDVVKSLEYLYSPDLRKKSIQVINSVPEDVVFRANQTDIYIVMANLFDNAIYWIYQDDIIARIIEFRAEKSEKAINIMVADNGPGVDPDIFDIIFEAGISNKPDGTGLGLSIVKDIVQHYGGSIMADDDSELGGALFKISLPLSEV